MGTDTVLVLERSPIGGCVEEGDPQFQRSQDDAHRIVAPRCRRFAVILACACCDWRGSRQRMRCLASQSWAWLERRHVVEAGFTRVRLLRAARTSEWEAAKALLAQPEPLSSA